MSIGTRRETAAAYCLATRIPGNPQRSTVRRVWLDLGLVLRPEAARTDVESARLSVLVDGRLMDVRKPSGVGTPLRVADVVTGHTSLAANFTLCHNLFDRLSRIEYTCGTLGTWIFHAASS